jgi:hypothetical protein
MFQPTYSNLINNGEPTRCPIKSYALQTTAGKTWSNSYLILYNAAVPASAYYTVDTNVPNTYVFWIRAYQEKLSTYVT